MVESGLTNTVLKFKAVKKRRGTCHRLQEVSMAIMVFSLENSGIFCRTFLSKLANPEWLFLKEKDLPNCKIAA